MKLKDPTYIFVSEPTLGFKSSTESRNTSDNSSVVLEITLSKERNKNRTSTILAKGNDGTKRNIILKKREYIKKNLHRNKQKKGV